MDNTAILSHAGAYSSFQFRTTCIRFRTSSRLERYSSVLQWDRGYLVVMAKYRGRQEEEETIDLVPILENLYFDPVQFLKPIENVRIEYVQ